MNGLTHKLSTSGRSMVRGFAWLGSAAAWAVAAVLGAVIAMFLAASVVVIALMGSVVVALAGAALKARRAVRAPADPAVIEARRVGGHSWVAYGWDGRA